MKRKVLTTVCVTLIMLSFLISYCDQTSINPSNNGNSSLLVGTWKSTTNSGQLVLKSSIVQTIFDLFSQGTGALTVTGTPPISLTYLFAIASDFLLAINQPFAPGQEISEVEHPFHIFSLMNNATNYLAKTSAVDSTLYTGSTTGIAYDSTSHTLKATNVQLTSLDLTKTVTVNGTLSNKSITIPANTQTEVADMTQMMDAMTMTITLDEDSTSTTIMLEEGEPDTTSGTWFVSGNILTIIDAIDDNGTTVYDTTEVAYTLNGNSMTVTVDQDMCDADELDEGETVPECLLEIEDMLDMQSNSLVEAFIRMTMNFTKQ